MSSDSNYDSGTTPMIYTARDHEASSSYTTASWRSYAAASIEEVLFGCNDRCWARTSRADVVLLSFLVCAARAFSLSSLNSS